MLKLKRIGAANLLAALTLVTACEDSSRNYATNFDPPVESQERLKLFQTMKEAGARQDATLYADHFDSVALSSLGKEKLDLMLADSHSKDPFAVYLDVPNDADAQARQTAVSHYLMDKGGLKSAQIQITMGANPDTNNPVANDLKNYEKTDTAADLGSSGGGGSGGSSSGAGH